MYFLKKMRQYLLPYGDLLCYCLMPNHFHWLMYVHSPIAEVARSGSGDKPSMRTLNDSIGILLRSYAQAVNKQEDRTGALFREETKAKDGWEDPFMAPADPDYGKVWKDWALYGATCFNYIHHNPVRAGLVADVEEWPYSSGPDYAGRRNGSLCNRALAKELLGLP